MLSMATFTQQTLKGPMQVPRKGFPPGGCLTVSEENVSWETCPIFHHLPLPKLGTSKENAPPHVDQSLPSGHCWQRERRSFIWWAVPRVAGHVAALDPVHEKS